jgi:hypothetical protein
VPTPVIRRCSSMADISLIRETDTVGDPMDKPKESRMTVRLNKEDEDAVTALRDHLRKTDPWIGRSGVMRFALGYAFADLQRSQATVR